MSFYSYYSGTFGKPVLDHKCEKFWKTGNIEGIALYFLLMMWWLGVFNLENCFHFILEIPIAATLLNINRISGSMSIHFMVILTTSFNEYLGIFNGVNKTITKLTCISRPGLWPFFTNKQWLHMAGLNNSFDSFCGTSLLSHTKMSMVV